jgi:hypothetical protein
MSLRLNNSPDRLTGFKTAVHSCLWFTTVKEYRLKDTHVENALGVKFKKHPMLRFMGNTSFWTNGLQYDKSLRSVMHMAAQ